MSADFKGINILSLKQREMIKRRIAMNEARLRGEIVVPTNRKAGPEGMSARRTGRWSQFVNKDIHEDPAMVRRQLKRDKAILERGSPIDLGKRERRRLEKSAQEQREWLQKRMCPKNLYHKGYNDPEFDRAKKACMREYDPRFQKVANSYKNVMRQLDPNRPEASNLETIRPKS